MPKRKVEFRLSPAAVDDLETIWRYTFDTWGQDQANLYTDNLVSAFEKLAINPSMGLASGHVRDGYRRHLSGRHVIYFQATPYGAAIIRVLHERMNAPQHL